MRRNFIRKSLMVSVLLGAVWGPLAQSAVILSFSDRGDGGFRMEVNGQTTVTNTIGNFSLFRMTTVAPGFLPVDRFDYVGGFPAPPVAVASGSIRNENTATEFSAASAFIDADGGPTEISFSTFDFSGEVGDLVTFDLLYDFVPDPFGFSIATPGTYAFEGSSAAFFRNVSEFTAIVRDSGDTTQVPEPSILTLLSVGLIGLGFARRRGGQA